MLTKLLLAVALSGKELVLSQWHLRKGNFCIDITFLIIRL